MKQKIYGRSILFTVRKAVNKMLRPLIFCFILQPPCFLFLIIHDFPMKKKLRASMHRAKPFDEAAAQRRAAAAGRFLIFLECHGISCLHRHIRQ